MRTFASASWTIRKTSICSSGASERPGSTSSSTSSCAVCGEDVDVAPESRVEGCVAARGGEGEDGEPRLLLREGRRSLDLPDAALGRVSGLEHARVRRDREEVLGEPVMDLARDACAFLGHGAPELGKADRPPDAGHEDAVRDEPQEVALGDERAGDRGREHVVKLGEERERRGEPEPAVEVVSVVR